jgi:CheY-like chemotaxis protein
MPKILIVDDNKLKRDALVMVLENERHTILTASDGVEGLALAHAEKPDLVIADLIMPRMDGYDFCKALRADPQLATIPIVVNSIMEDAKVHLLMRDCKLQFFIPLGARRKEILDITNAALEQSTAPFTLDLTPEELALELEEVLAELKALSAKLPPPS